MKYGLDPEPDVRLGVDGTLATLAARDTTFQDCIGKLLAGRGYVGLFELPLYPLEAVKRSRTYSTTFTTVNRKHSNWKMYGKMWTSDEYLGGPRIESCPRSRAKTAPRAIVAGGNCGPRH